MRSRLRDRVKVRSTAAVIVFTILLCLGLKPPLSAQTMTIRLLNAKTGTPMKNKLVTFDWGERWDRSEIAFDKQGFGTIEVPAGANKFSLLAGPKVGKEPYRIPYLDCNEPKMELFIRVSLVLEKGYVLGNTCGHESTVAQPGVIVMWALPNPWWKPDMQ